MIELVSHEQSPMDFDTIGRDTCCLQSNMYVIVALLTHGEVASRANGKPQIPHKHLCLISISRQLALPVRARAQDVTEH